MSDSRYDLYFMDVPEGRAFYPLGSWGRGYLVDVAQESEARQLLQRLQWLVPVFLPFFLVIRDVVGHVLGIGFDHHSLWSILLFVPVLMAIHTAVLKWQVRGLTWTPVRMTFATTMTRTAATVSPLVVTTMRINSAIIFGAITIMMVLVGEPVMAGLCLVAGVAIVVFYGLVARQQSRLRDGAGPSDPGLRQP